MRLYTTCQQEFIQTRSEMKYSKKSRSTHITLVEFNHIQEDIGESKTPLGRGVRGGEIERERDLAISKHHPAKKPI